VSDEAITTLLGEGPFAFVGTVEHVGAATMSDIPIDGRTAVVRVDHVLQAPEALPTLDGQRITVQLKDDAQPGEQAAFFAQGLAFGESVAVTEVGRVGVDAVEPHVTRGFEAGEPAGFEALKRQAEAVRVREHADAADAVVVGRVVGLEDVLEPVISEHDPDWWRATIDVAHVEKGDVQTGPLQVLYANSLDVKWRLSPKPKASQEGLWILHATEGDQREAARFQIPHQEDYQSVQRLDDLRDGGS
jgi:hypothetical protein